MRHIGLLVATLPLAGCVHAGGASPVPAAPPPARIEAPLPPPAALLTAAAELRRAGFYVTAIDTIARRLNAESSESALAGNRLIECAAPAGNRSAEALPPLMIVELSAIPTPSGSALTMQTRVRTSYLRMTADARRPDTENECRSDGTVERRVASSLNARTP